MCKTGKFLTKPFKNYGHLFTGLRNKTSKEKHVLKTNFNLHYYSKNIL